MSCSLLTPYFLLCLGVFLHSGGAQVLTESPTGPLYRVEGSKFSITCNVSGFSSHSATKDFEYRFLHPANPSNGLNVISTRTKSFGYAMYSSRVRDGEIKLTHTSPNSVVFEIQELQRGDEGEFECLVLNSEAVYNGIYSAATAVKVIDNSLRVSSPASALLTYNEGTALTLSCQASSSTLQHTHLSLGWYLHKSGEASARPIVSISRDFTVTAGPGFEGRHLAGLIRLDKVGEATYKLEIAKLEVSDQGEIYCRAQEWIQDPDRSWYSIAQEDSQRSNLTVRARELRPTSSLVTARLSVQQSSLQEGQELSLTCSIDAQNPEGKFFSVAWMHEALELARIGPTGILSVGPQLSEREKDGDFRASRAGTTDYQLTLQPVRTQDQGDYRCTVWPEERGQDGAFQQGQAQNSNSVMVSISATTSGLTVEMDSAVSVNEGDRLTLTCKMGGIKGQLSVAWQRKSPHAAAFSHVVGLDPEGVLEEPLTGRGVSATRPAADTFTLELEEVTEEDSGEYQCVVSEWETNSKTTSRSQKASVTVVPIESIVNKRLALTNRNHMAALGDDVELICRVPRLTLPVTLSWTLQRDGASLDTVLTMYADGSISWGREQHSYQLKVKENQNKLFYYLVINGVSRREEGRYQCHIGVSLKNVPKKMASTSVLVIVREPASTLSLSPDPSLIRHVNTDVEVRCTVTSEPSATSRYAVTWLLRQQARNLTLLSTDQNGLVTFGPTLEPNHRRRISALRSVGPAFQLSVRRAQTSDQGSYVCEVVEWLQASKSEWYPLPAVAQSIKVTLLEPANDLRVNATQQSLAAREGDEVELECNIAAGAFTPSLFYAVSWLYGRDEPSSPEALVKLDHTGLLTYPQSPGLAGLQGRLRLSRPTQSSFRLHIQRSHEEDGGSYRCLVEQFHLDSEGQWQQKASDSAGPVTVTVRVPGKNLSVSQEEVRMNVSASQEFSVPCHVTRQSSAGSEFQVTWFFQKDSKLPEEPIFKADRNSTRQFRADDELRFSRPAPSHFSLTLLKLGPENSGRYFCEVEEWVPSLSRGWRRVAVERSGHYSISVHADGGERGEQCQSSTFLAILTPIILLLLFVVFLLVLKLCRSKEVKKPQPSLWTEQHPLNSKLSADG